MAKKKTQEEFVFEVEEKGNGDYEVLSRYENNKVHVRLKHVSCGHEYMVQPNSFLNGRRCPNCSKSFYDKKTHADFLKEVETKGDREYEVISIYENNNTKVVLKHLSCGLEYKVRPRNFLKGNRCPDCSNILVKNEKGTRKRKTHEYFMEEVKELGDGDYEALSKYKNGRTYVLMKHVTCGHQYNVRPCDFLRGRRCPKCRVSKGELLIKNYLEKSGIPFMTQAKFPGCKNLLPLPFDFGIKDTDGNILLLIEYDGEQHFKEMNFFGGRKAFVQRVRNDRIKSNFAKAQGIPLLRISYKQENQEEFLKHALEGFFAIRKKNRKTA